MTRVRRRMISMETDEVSVDSAQALSIPLARVKKLMKADPDVKLELFLKQIGSVLNQQANQERRRTILYRDVSRLVKQDARLSWLEDLCPPTMTLKQALELRSSLTPPTASMEIATAVESIEVDQQQQAEPVIIATDPEVIMLD